MLLFIASSAETDWEEDQDATVRIIWRPSWLVPSPIVILSTATQEAEGKGPLDSNTFLHL